MNCGDQPLLKFLWLLCAVGSIGCFFLPWRFTVAGFRFPYHGWPALAAAVVASAAGLAAWSAPRFGWPGRQLWLTAGFFGLVEALFPVAFILAPETFVGAGRSFGPLGETPFTIDLTLPPKPAVSFVAGTAAAGAVLSVLLAWGAGTSASGHTDAVTSGQRANW